MPHFIHRARATVAMGDIGKAVVIAFLALAAFIPGPPPAHAADDGGVRMVTQNMYVGSSTGALVAAHGKGGGQITA